MASVTRATMSALTYGKRLTTFETVRWDTPARRATSAWVTGTRPPCLLRDTNVAHHARCPEHIDASHFSLHRPVGQVARVPADQAPRARCVAGEQTACPMSTPGES